MRRPHNQFAFRYWFGLSLAMVAMIIFTWKVGCDFFVVVIAGVRALGVASNLCGLHDGPVTIFTWKVGRGLPCLAALPGI